MVGVGGIVPPFLTSALDGDEWLASCSGRFTLRETAPGTRWIVGLVVRRAGLDAMKKRKISYPSQDSKPDRLTRS
jgi:hypothetical protein